MTGRFSGSDYVPREDDARLSQQHVRVRELMRDGGWRTLAEIAAVTGDPQPSISAQLRHLRKARFGAWRVEKRARGERSIGLFEYRLLPPALEPAPEGRPGVPDEATFVRWRDALARYVRAARAAGAPDDATVFELGRWLSARGRPRTPA